jgi:hypothetical protein
MAVKVQQLAIEAIETIVFFLNMADGNNTSPWLPAAVIKSAHRIKQSKGNGKVLIQCAWKE